MESKKMRANHKFIPRLFASLILLLCFTNLQAQEKQIIRKSYTGGAEYILDISNKYGDIEITTWEKPNVEAVITIGADGNNDSKNQKRIESVEIRERKYGNRILLETLYLSDGIFRFIKNDTRVNYRISMPREMALQIDNRFGNVFIDDIMGDVEVLLNHGNLTTEDLKGRNNRLDVSFGTLDAVNIVGGSVKIGFGKLVIGNAGTISINSNSASVDIFQANKIQLNGNLGSVTIGEIGEITGEYGAGNIQIEKLKHTARLTMKSAANLEVDEVAQGFAEIDLQGSFSGFRIGFQPNADFELDAQLDHGSLSFNGAEVPPDNPENDTQTYRQSVGSMANAGKLTIRNKYGNVRIFR
jgi:hypothetical protein